MITSEPGQLFSGQLAYNLWTGGSIYVYQYTHGKAAIKGLVRFSEGPAHRNYTIEHNNDGVLHPFDFSGFLHTMNTDSWQCVVFDNFWYAWAYEQKIKQGKQNADARAVV